MAAFAKSCSGFGFPESIRYYLVTWNLGPRIASTAHVRCNRKPIDRCSAARNSRRRQDSGQMGFGAGGETLLSLRA